MYYYGIDIAKYKHEATVIDKTGKALLDSISLSYSKEGCEKLLALFKEYYQSLRVRGKHHLTAIDAVSRKLCNTIYVILKEDRLWQPLPLRAKS